MPRAECAECNFYDDAYDMTTGLPVHYKEWNSSRLSRFT